MEQTVNERIMILWKKSGLSKTDFVKRVGISYPAFYMLEKEKRKPHSSTIRAICTALNVNSKWLETGEGDIGVNFDTKFELSNSEIDFKSLYKDLLYKQLKEDNLRLQKQNETLFSMLSKLMGEKIPNFPKVSGMAPVPMWIERKTGYRFGDYTAEIAVSAAKRA